MYLEYILQCRLKQPYKVDYAETGRAKCRHCKELIQQDSIRFGMIVKHRVKENTLYPEYCHFPECFLVDHIPQVTGDIYHFTSMKYDDMKMIEDTIRNLRERHSKTLTEKAASLSPQKKFSNVDCQAFKKLKREDIEEEIRWQYEQLYDYIEELKKMDLEHLRQLMRANNQDETLSGVGKKELLADCLLFGSLEDCPKCQKGQLLLGTDSYLCCGYPGQNDRCNYEIRAPSRRPFVVPDHLRQKYAFLKDYKYVRRTKIMPSVELSTKLDETVEEVLTMFITWHESSDDDAGEQELNFAMMPELIQRCSHVYTEMGRRFNADLIREDTTTRRIAFLRMQLREINTEVKLYFVYRDWGSEDGESPEEYRLNHFHCKDKAVRFFDLFYFRETGNNLSPDPSDFEKKSHKFYPRGFIEDDPQPAFDKFQQLHPRVRDLLNILFDIRLYERKMEECNIDTTKMPLGIIKFESIKAAYDVLRRISFLLRGDNPDDAQLHQATNELYAIIPHVLRHQSGISVIRTFDEVRKKAEMLASLEKIGIGFDIYSQNSPALNDHLCECYKNLNTTIEYLGPNTLGFKMIRKYIKSTWYPYYRIDIGSLEIVDAFGLTRHEDCSKGERFVEVGNPWLLWHGSPVENFVGIMVDGLKIAPVFYGQNFGLGIYFTDMVSKATFFSHRGGTIKQSDGSLHGFLLLCEVALGNRLDVLDKNPDMELPEDYNSVRHVGKFDLAIEYVNSVAVPCGGFTRNDNATSQAPSEYIVYDADQVKIKYLVRVKYVPCS